MSLSQLGALIVADPAQAKKKILAAFVKAEGRREQAAVELGVHVRSVYRSLDRLNLWDALDAEMTKHGFEIVVGPPRSRELMIRALVEAGGDLKRAAAALDYENEADLRRRIEEIELAPAANKVLKAAGLATIERPKAKKRSA